MTHQKEKPASLQTGNGLGKSAGTAPDQFTPTRGRRTSPVRLAPYARAVLDLLRASKNPNVYLFAGSDAWNQAEHRRRTHGEGSTLVSPPGDDPQTFRWPPLDALVLIPGDAEGETIRRLVIALLTAGCRCVVELRHDPARSGRGLAPACHYASADDALEVAA